PLFVLGDLFRAQDALIEEALLEPLETIVLREKLDLLLGPVAALVVLGRMRSQAIDQALDQRRAFTRACSGDSLLGDDVAGHRVTTVERHSREPIARGALRDVLDRVFLSKGRRDRETVVLANEDLRELVDGREVEGLVRVAFRARALAVAG